MAAHKPITTTMGVAAADDATSGDRGLDSLFEKHGGRVEVVLARLAKNGHAVGEGTAYDAIWALRFCLSNESDDDAVSNAEETLVWRAANRQILDAAASGQKLAKFAALEDLVITDYHGFTKSGSPLFVVRAGISNPGALMDDYSFHDVVEFLMYRKELGFLLCDKITRGTNTLTKLVTINDLNHVSLVSGTDSRFSKVLGAVSKISEAVYPQLLDRAVLINVPYVFSTMWSLVKGFLSKKTVGKVSVCAVSDTRSGDIGKCPFAKFLDLETVPSFLGGNCRCAGGCLCGVSNEQTTMVGVTNAEGFTSAYVAARGSHTVWRDCSAGDVVVCRVAVDDGKGIAIGVSVAPTPAKDAPQKIPTTLVKKFKHKPRIGGAQWEHTLTVPINGTLVLELGNEGSLLTGKQVQYKVDVVRRGT